MPVITIILDTNFLLIPFLYKVDIFVEIARICNKSYELSIVKETIDELDNIIEKGKQADRIAANAAKSLIKTKSINILEGIPGKIVDDSIVEITDKNPKNYIVATQDKGLKSRLKTKIIFMRQKSHLVIE